MAFNPSIQANNCIAVVISRIGYVLFHHLYQTSCFGATQKHFFTSCRYGLPVSSSQVITGAIVGVGALEGITGVNWKWFGVQLTSWVCTMIFMGVLVGAVFAQVNILLLRISSLFCANLLRIAANTVHLTSWRTLSNLTHLTDVYRPVKSFYRVFTRPDAPPATM